MSSESTAKPVKQVNPRKQSNGPPTEAQLEQLRAEKLLAKQMKENQAAGILTASPIAAVTSNIASVNISPPLPPPPTTVPVVSINHNVNTESVKPVKIPPSIDNPVAQANKQQKLLAKDKQRELSHATSTTQANTANIPNRIHLFDHLQKKIESKSSKYMEHQYLARTNPSTTLNRLEKQENTPIHPAIIKLALYYRKGIIRDDDDRVIALIVAFKSVIQDYTTPPKKTLCWDLDKYISSQVCVCLYVYTIIYNDCYICICKYRFNI